MAADQECRGRLQVVSTTQGAETTAAETAARTSLAGSRHARDRSASRAPGWRKGYLRFLVVADVVGVMVGASLANVVRTSGQSAAIGGTSLRLPYFFVSLLVAVLWLVTLTLNRVFNVRVLGAGTDEYRRILDAIIRLLFGVAASAFLLHLSLSRSYIAIVGPDRRRLDLDRSLGSPPVASSPTTARSVPATHRRRWLR